MANGAEVARAFVTIVPTMQGAQAEITKELTGITDQAAKRASGEACLTSRECPSIATRRVGWARLLATTSAPR